MVRIKRIAFKSRSLPRSGGFATRIATCFAAGVQIADTHQPPPALPLPELQVDSSSPPAASQLPPDTSAQPTSPSARPNLANAMQPSHFPIAGPFICAVRVALGQAITNTTTSLAGGFGSTRGGSPFSLRPLTPLATRARMLPMTREVLKL